MTEKTNPSETLAQMEDGFSDHIGVDGRYQQVCDIALDEALHAALKEAARWAPGDLVETVVALIAEAEEIR